MFARPRQLSFVILACAALSAAGATEAPQWDRLDPHIEMLRGRFVAGAQPDGNSVLIDSTEGVLVFDAGRHPAHTEAIVERLRQRGVQSIVLLNSHWHLDHSGGLARLRAAYPDAVLHASRAIEQARGGFLQRYHDQLTQLLAKAQPGAPPPAVLRAERSLIEGSAAMQPDAVLERSETRELLGRELRLGLGRGVSGGDLWLYDPRSRVLLAGDLVTLPAPLFDTACPEQWRSDLADLAAVNFDWLLPGHGRALQRSEFDQWHAAFSTLLDCAASAAEAAQCRQGWIDATASLVGDGDRELSTALLDYYLTARLRAEPAVRDEYCGGAPRPAA